MAASAFSLHHLRSTARHPSRHPTFLLHFSSSSSSTSPPPSTSSSTSPSSTSSPNPNPNTDSFSSYFSDVKASLTNNSPPPPPRQQFQKQFSAPPPPPRQQQQQPASIEQIRRDLSEFRRRTAPPDSALNPSPPARPVSFQELYQRNVTNKEGDSSNQMNKGRGISFDAIAESIRQMKAKSSKTNQDPLSLKNLKENFMLRPADPRPPPFVMGSPRKLPETSYSKEKKDGDATPEMKTEFVKMYSYKELGEKLRMLRPEGKPEDGFSLQELNDRLIKLREMEERESAAKIGKVPFVELRQSLFKIQSADDGKKQKQLQMFTAFNRTPDYMEKPPKEHLVEKYFHPDNMSSAEKLKIELQKVRDEFKMSESDCGSARVQVAQLTTKIKHLTTALHKKDTHSRKGLQGMIQQRKKLLKYLRRTDWDSYTLVLSKFGLRDNPDHKRLPTKEKKIRKA